MNNYSIRNLNPEETSITHQLSEGFFTGFLFFFDKIGASNLLPETDFFDPLAFFFWSTVPAERVELRASLPHSESDRRLEVLLPAQTRDRQFAALQALYSASKALRRSSKNVLYRVACCVRKASLSPLHKSNPAVTKKIPASDTARWTALIVWSLMRPWGEYPAHITYDCTRRKQFWKDRGSKALPLRSKVTAGYLTAGIPTNKQQSLNTRRTRCRAWKPKSNNR